jgi:predicted nucleotidyltransferase
VNLEQEAVSITEELGEVVFIGALAVNHYTKYRGTKDIDLVAAFPLDEEKLRELGYRRRETSRSSWYTPRGIKADFYTKDVGRIPVGWIAKTSAPMKVGKDEIRVISLEGLIIAKYRAGRSQDVADLRQLMANCSKDIDWEKAKEIGTDMEITELKGIAKALGA